MTRWANSKAPSKRWAPDINEEARAVSRQGLRDPGSFLVSLLCRLAGNTGLVAFERRDRAAIFHDCSGSDQLPLRAVCRSHTCVLFRKAQEQSWAGALHSGLLLGSRPSGTSLCVE